LARALLGDTIFANILTLGVAYQKGLIPVSASAIEEAIRLNGVAVEKNLAAFRWGRAAAHYPAAISHAAGLTQQTEKPAQETLEEILARNEKLLTNYQNAAYARDYRAFVNEVRDAEAEKTGTDELARAVANVLAKLMAYKDEYEVARLYADPAFRESLSRVFGDGGRVKLHMAPPLLARIDPETGEARKHAFGPWVLRLMPLLAKLKILRGTILDPFGHTRERRAERALVNEYRALVRRLLAGLTPDIHAQAVEIATVAKTIRGFGSVKLLAMDKAERKVREFLDVYENERSVPLRKAV